MIKDYITQTRLKPNGTDTRVEKMLSALVKSYSILCNGTEPEKAFHTGIGI